MHTRTGRSVLRERVLPGKKHVANHFQASLLCILPLPSANSQPSLYKTLGNAQADLPDPTGPPDRVGRLDMTGRTQIQGLAAVTLRSMVDTSPFWTWATTALLTRDWSKPEMSAAGPSHGSKAKA